MVNKKEKFNEEEYDDTYDCFADDFPELGDEDDYEIIDEEDIVEPLDNEQESLPEITEPEKKIDESINWNELKKNIFKK